MTETNLPGFDAVELLGYGSGGEVWLARERATGRPVALKRLAAGADLAARDRLRREAAVLAGVDHPHVVRLRAVHGDGDALVLVLDLAPGGSLARLLATRRRHAPGEVVTLAVPLAQALTAVHAQGVVHGDVTPANVLFAADGRPLLSDLGVSRLLGVAPGQAGGTRGYLDPAVAAGAGPGPPSDVHGLAATCFAALTGTPPYDEQGHRVPAPAGTPRALLEVLEPALAPDPADRPTAEALAAAVFDAETAEPVRFDPAALPLLGAGPLTGHPVAPPTHVVVPRHRPAEVTAGPRSRRRPPAAATGLPAALAVTSAAVAGLAAALRGRGRAVLAFALSGGALALAAATGVAWAGADDGARAAGVSGRPTPKAAGTAPVASPAPTASSAPDAVPAPIPGPAPDVGWAGTLAALDQARQRAFATGDPDRLRAVYATGAPALGRDRAVLGRLTGAGLRAVGVRLTVTSVAVDGRSAGRVRLAVTDVMPPYRLVDEGGTVVERRPGRGAQSWTVVLARGGGGWGVYDVLRG